MHRLFAKQLAKATDQTGTVELPQLSKLVVAAYEEFDRDRTRTDRSISLMVEELDQIQRNLERTVVERTKELRAREAELQAQNLRIDAALSNMSQGLAMYDAEARLVLWNDRFVSMYSYEPRRNQCRHAAARSHQTAVRQRHFGGNPDEYAESLVAQLRSARRRANLPNCRTAAPSRSRGRRWRTAAGWRPTRTLPSDAKRR